MAFLHKKGGGGGPDPIPDDVRQHTGSNLPGAQPKQPSVRAPVGGARLCPHCHKDIDRPPSQDVGNNPAVIQHYLDSILDSRGRLSEWERSFFDSIAEQFESRGSLSDKQLPTLTKIYDKATS